MRTIRLKCRPKRYHYALCKSKRIELLEPRNLLATLAVNAGGGVAGAFVADDFFTGGGTPAVVSSPIDLSGATNPAPEVVYQSERAGIDGGDFTYTLGELVAGSQYTVRLHFAEVFWNGAGDRLFDVAINGQTVLDDYDIFVEAGNSANAAVIEEFTPTASAGGEIVIEFVTEVDNAKVSGIELVGGTTLTDVEWMRAADAPLGIFEGQGAAIGDRLYYVGGFFNAVLDSAVDTYAYDPALDDWDRVADAPVGLTHAAQAVDGDNMYLIGGFAGDNPGGSVPEVYVYDSETDEWLPGTPLPEDRGGGGAAIVGRQLHYFGGATRTAGINVLVDHPDHWVLDLGPTDSPTDDATNWVPAADLPNPRNHMGAAALNGLIYAVGGQLGGDEEIGNQDDLQVYDPSTNEWTQLADIPIPLGHNSASTLVVNGQIWTIGGVTNGTTKVANVFNYDPVSNLWSELTPYPNPRQTPVAGVIGNKVVVTTGASDNASQSQTWFTEIPTQVPEVPGDYNADQTVDEADHSTWASGYGTTDLAADGNGDNAVDLADYTVWRDNMTSPAGLQHFAAEGEAANDPSTDVALVFSPQLGSAGDSSELASHVAPTPLAASFASSSELLLLLPSAARTSGGESSQQAEKKTVGEELAVENLLPLDLAFSKF